MIYLDNAATTPVKSEVLSVIMDVLQNNYGNPSSVYQYGLDSKRILEDSRKKIAEHLNCFPDEIIFTSGSCESNSLALHILSKDLNCDKRIFISKLEHKSINMALGSSDHYINNDHQGFIDIDMIEHICKKYKNNSTFNIAFSIQYANNEIGTIQYMNRISEIIHDYGYILHTDATQFIGNDHIDLQQLNVDLLSLSGQKIGTPKGIGLLYIKRGIKATPIIFGSQERGLRGGTENIAFIAGFAKAFDLLDYSNNTEVRLKRDYLWTELHRAIPETFINGSALTQNRLVNNLNICFLNKNGQNILYMLDNSLKCCVSMGSACNSGATEPSQVLLNLGLPKEEVNSSIRFTLSNNNSYEDINNVTNFLNIIQNKLK